MTDMRAPSIVLAVLGIAAALPIAAIVVDTLVRRWLNRSWRAAVFRGYFSARRVRRRGGPR